MLRLRCALASPLLVLLAAGPATAAEPAGAPALLDYQRALLAGKLLPILAARDQCPQRYRLVRELDGITEWHCPALAPPGGTLAGGGVRQQLMVKDGGVFAVATILDEDEAALATELETFYRSGLARACACTPAENEVTYCQCPDLETRLVRVGRSIGLLTIGDAAAFVEYQAAETRAARTPTH